MVVRSFRVVASGRSAAGLPAEAPIVPLRPRPGQAEHFLGRGRARAPVLRDWQEHNKEVDMNSVAKVSEISARSDKSFEDAILVGISRASKTLRNVASAWVKEQRVDVKDGKIVCYQVNMMVTFVLDE
jgi:flavin-binding protein dodecin